VGKVADGFKIADAFVEIHTDSDSIGNEVRGALRHADVDRDSRSLGRRSGSGIGRGLVDSLGGRGGIVSSVLSIMATRAGVLAAGFLFLAGVADEASGALGLLAPAAWAGGLAVGTLAVATHGFGQAIKDVGDPKKFAEDIGSLSPNAQAAAISIRNLTPEFSALKNAVQNRFFAGLGDQFSRLAGAYLPMVQTAMTIVAGSMNGLLNGLANDFMTVRRQADMKIILDNATSSVGNILKGVRPLVDAFFNLSVVAAPIFTNLTKDIGPLATKFDEWTQKVRSDGSMREWVTRGWQAVQNLWTIFTTLFGTVSDLITAFGGPAGITAQIKWFADKLASVAEWIKNNRGWLQPLIMTLGGIGIALKIAQTAIQIFFAFKWLAANPWVLLVAGLVIIVAYIITHWEDIKRYLATAWNWIKNTAVTIWTAIKNFFGSINNAISGTFRTVWNGIKNFAAGIWNGIKAVASAIWGAIKTVIGNDVNGIRNIISWFHNLPGMISGWFSGAKNAAVNAFNAMVGFVRGIPGRIAGALGNLSGLLVNAGRSLITGLWNGIKGAFGWVKDKVAGLMGGLRRLFPFSPAKEGPFSGTGYTSFSGEAMVRDWAKGMLSQQGVVQDAVSTLMGGMQPVFAVNATGVGGGASLLSSPAVTPASASDGGSSSVTHVGSLTIQVAGNLDPTNATAWRQAMENIRDGVRNVERSKR
jgi:phage-related protein